MSPLVTQGRHRFRLGNSLRRTYLRLRLPYASRVDIAGWGNVSAAGWPAEPPQEGGAVR